MRTLYEGAHCPLALRDLMRMDEAAIQYFGRLVDFGRIGKNPGWRTIDHMPLAISHDQGFNDVGGAGRSGGVLMSLKFNTVLNSMLNSPKFCHR